mmetsp:Transcript_127426/g.407811  ORF Transcript_127426/g.407811 Transcript_127426/m.407811 type:complete len:276 (-) Transcript_127426:2272-3099(-)
MLPRLPKRPFVHQYFAICESFVGCGATELRQLSMTLLLALRVLKLTVHRQQLPPQLGAVRHLSHRRLQSLQGVLPRSDVNLNSSYLRVDCLALLEAWLALQRAAEVVDCLTGTGSTLRSMQLGNVEVALVVSWPRVQQPLKPTQGILVFAGFSAHGRQCQHSRRVPRLQRQRTLQRPHGLLGAAVARASSAEGREGGSVGRRDLRRLQRKLLGLSTLPRVEGDLGQPHEGLGIVGLGGRDLLVELLRPLDLPPGHAYPRKAQQRLCIAGLRAQRR